MDALFTLTGGHISPIFDGCKDRGIRVIDVRHEQAAAHAADAYGRLTFRPGVAAVTAGPGVTDAITGVTNAFYANSPMVLLGGRNPLALEGMGALQDAPQLELLRPVTKRVDTTLETRRIREVLDASFRAALAPRMGPTYVDLPMDVLMTPVDPDHVVAAGGQRATVPPGPDPDAVAATAGLLAQAERPVVLCGSGTYWSRASQELDALARTAQLPVFVNGMARGILPSDHPNLLGLSRKQALRQADLVLALGIDFDFRVGYGRPPAYRDDVAVVHVDPQPDRIGHNRPVTHGIVSDVASFLRALLSHDATFGRTKASPWLEELTTEEGRRREARDAAASSDASPVHPLRFAREVARWADPDAIVIGDGGDIVAHTAGQVRVDRPGHWMDPGPFGCLGVGAPFALAAAHVHPDKQVLVVYGDGSFGFNAMEFESAARQGLPFVGVVGNDGAWGEMKAFHERVYGSEGMVAQDLTQDVSYEGVVTALGGYGQRVERPEDIGPALDRAAASGVPALVNVLLDRGFRRESAAAYGA
ncbi:MAG: thiamine pyrophosphate protein central region [Nitriliruptor sp.]|nr:MAG: thiamine pyrophosphate protein central region [Nitriliruptor sp.]